MVPTWLKSISEYEIGRNNISVSIYSLKLVQQCLNEDSLLFLRNLTERMGMTKSNELSICPNEAVVMMSKILSLFAKNSAWEMHRQSKKIIANYLVGLIMTLMRTCEKHQDARINQIMPILEKILPHIYGITIKQLKVKGMIFY